MSEARPSPFTAPALRAIILRDDNDKLIVQASKKEISAFAQPKGQPVQIRPTSPDMLMRFRGRHHEPPETQATFAQPDPYTSGRVILNPDDFLYNVNGEPVARIMELEMIYHSNIIEVTTFGSSNRDYIAGDGTGGSTINLRATGLPNTRLR